MGNRPINRRPWRRPPRIKRREARWIDANSVGSGGDPCITGPGGIICDDDVPGSANRSSVRELTAGGIDLEWSDSNEVLHERLVGSIALASTSLVPFDSASPISMERPLVRMGLLVVEDASPGTASLTDLQKISLWDNQHLQTYEWMWLHQTYGDPHFSLSGDTMYAISETDVPLDVRSRRKLGRTDRLVLLASFKATTGSAAGFYTHLVSLWPMLRSVVTTK